MSQKQKHPFRQHSLRLLNQLLLFASIAVLGFISLPLAKAQFAIPSYTIDAGGGTSTGGNFALTGTIGQPDASAPSTGGTYAISGGFWAANTNPYSGGYTAWATANIGSGLDATFDGDSNQDGIPNGIAYIFGEDGAKLLGKGILTAPPLNLPGDVDLVLEVSPDLQQWDPVMEIISGVQTYLDPDFSISAGELTDSTPGVRQFFQYRATLIP